jgi:hypothetical protein
LKYRDLIHALNKRAMPMPFLAFAIPFIIRLIPEIMIGIYPAGFDTVAYYIPFTYDVIFSGTNWYYLFSYGPLLYFLLYIPNFLGLQVVTAIKIIAPILHGILGYAIYTFANKRLNWKTWKSILVSLLATLYFTSLRISWDLLRQQLGTIFLFASLTLLPDSQKEYGSRRLVLFSIFTVLTVLSNQFPYAIIVVYTAFLVIDNLRKGQNMVARRIILLMVPALLVFVSMVYITKRPMFSIYSNLEPTGLFQIFEYKSYADMLDKILGFLIYCYIPLIPFALLGMLKLKTLELKIWVLSCLALILFPLVSLIQIYHIFEYRWTLLLGYPLAFYVIEGMANLNFNHSLIRSARARYTVIAIFILATSYLSFGFMIMPPETPIFYFSNTNFNRYANYVPTSMLQNTISINDIKDTEKALEWVKNLVDNESCLLTHIAYRGQALLLLNRTQIYYYGYEAPKEAALQALSKGYSAVYLIWWVRGYGWYGQPSVSSDFLEVYRSGRIAIYTHMNI